MGRKLLSAFPPRRILHTSTSGMEGHCKSPCSAFLLSLLLRAYPSLPYHNTGHLGQHRCPGLPGAPPHPHLFRTPGLPGLSTCLWFEAGQREVLRLSAVGGCALSSREGWVVELKPSLQKSHEGIAFSGHLGVCFGGEWSWNVGKDVHSIDMLMVPFLLICSLVHSLTSSGHLDAPRSSPLCILLPEPHI